MTKVKVTEIIRDFDDTEIKDGDKPMSYRRALWMALNAPEQNETTDDKYRLYKLISRIMGSEEVSFTADDITLINKKAGKVYTPILVGRIKEFLEADLKEESKNE